MNIFKGKIKCKLCGNRNYNFKNDHGQHIYLCSTYKNYGYQHCPRNVIFEKDLISIISKHINLQNKDRVEVPISELSASVLTIEVNGQHLKIYYTDGTTSEWNNEKLTF